ncbi:MAG TPA: class II SORL domain-containing protein [Candidatus Omnitrophota bacterium]|nr:class II SORL domain-containing protein [Candidatus Omnitrophota bacterium]HOX09508.1 class II SORL domain-containing protein [Candidatus Omnitrophota bacterium]HRZ66751.1 class II SORL domain-containing protein [Candidatus Omnitrophota bacterium]
MASIKELLQDADWKAEKHVPVIDAPEKAKKGEPVKVTVTVGKEIPHPNKTEHHISWIKLFFLPNSEKFPYEIGQADFTAHGASIQGPDTSTVYTDSEAQFTFRTDKPGTILAESYCNIHGLWENSKTIEVG